VTQLIVCFRKFCELACNGVKYIYIYIYIYIHARNRSHADRKANGHDLPSRNDCFQLLSDIREELFQLSLL